MYKVTCDGDLDKIEEMITKDCIDVNSVIWVSITSCYTSRYDTCTVNDVAILYAIIIMDGKPVGVVMYKVDYCACSVASYM